MKVRLASLTIAALCATAPALAQAPTETFYVPLIESAGPNGTVHATVIWISNPGTAARSAKTRLLENGKPPGQQTTVGPIAPGRTSVLVALPTVGMLEIVGDSGLAVESRSRSTSPGGVEVITALPVIAANQVIEARATTQILGLLRDPAKQRTQHFSVMNPGNAAAACELSFFRADGTQIGSTSKIQVAAASVRHFSDALAILGEQSIADVRAQATCDKPFYPFGVLFDATAAQNLIAGPSVGGTVAFEEPLDPNADFVFERLGIFHTSSQGKPKERFKLPVAAETRFDKLVAEVEFNIGRWNVRCSPTNHSILWLYRDQPNQPFRSNTIANVAAFNNNQLRANQNVDLPKGSNTNNTIDFAWQLGVWYKMRYTYDARQGDVSVELLRDGVVLETFGMNASGRSGVITVPTYGMAADFGHNAGQHCPEVNSINMQWRNFRVTGYTR